MKLLFMMECVTFRSANCLDFSQYLYNSIRYKKTRINRYRNMGGLGRKSHLFMGFHLVRLAIRVLLDKNYF